MIRLILLSALCAVALAGYAQQGHGQGGYGHGHGGHGGHGHGHYRRPYNGYGWVNVWQTPYAYQYGLNEAGQGYGKWVQQAASFHNSQPVKYPTHGHGGYH